LSFIEEQSELADFSVDSDFKDATELIDPFFDLLFGVGLGTSQGTVRDELRYRAVFEGLLSATGLDVDSNGGLVAWPVFGGYSDTIGELGDSGGS
jgi:hypothetical protein